jgi:hypothetical protein
MPITLDQLTGHYPFVYHMAERDALPQLRRHGLLSTTAALDLFEVPNAERVMLEARIRKDTRILDHPVHGRITLRDQKPLSESKLAGCLQDGLSTEDWLRLLNRKTFFWLGRDKVETLLGGRAYRDREHIVLEFRTETLVNAHRDHVTLAAMNTGSTSPFAHERGLSTMLPLGEFPYEDRRKRGLRPAAELSIDYSVPDLEALIENAHVGSHATGLVERNDLLA